MLAVKKGLWKLKIKLEVKEQLQVKKFVEVKKNWK